MPDLEREGNPAIPSGYTYLLQLAAHDCVQTPTPFWQMPQGRVAARNGRMARLRLDTLYGLGPFASPHAYAPDDARDITRSALRLGPMRRPAGATGPAPQRDIARVSGPTDAAAPPLTDPLICDPRNEDHAILAQMTALWHLVHNAFLGLSSGGRAAGPADRAREPHFAWARAATTLVYRRILRDDLLARLLHGPVQDRYRRATAADLLDPDSACPGSLPGVALEFSHGAMRAAHSMVRPEYRINAAARHGIKAALRQTSARGAAQMPLGANWIIRWSDFFDGLAPTPAANRSLLIKPRYIAALINPELFEGPAPGHGLAMQDLASAATVPLWSVDALHDAIAAQAARKGWTDAFDDQPLADAAYRHAALAAWLAARSNRFDPLPAADIASLAADPPLPFYVLFEAEHTHGGARLGPLGSILLAETFYGAMLGDPLPGEQPGQWPEPALRPALLALAGALGITVAADRLPDQAMMPALIRFVAREHGLEAADPAFL
ncbi:peroxidase family protein [Falsiroseomonas selenitidurans]|uniref:Animal haem peroxidase n=1 Tax=Falsiroseomonas selenitidurans TaxID=2716335 RepID=A0ABX1E8H8_9PROT|nr:hypothetical protein [Falsiroseomonas selenitidurans]NKC31195.1 hypothetical protein [Falsiroseomonas selenitidurans]